MSLAAPFRIRPVAAASQAIIAITFAAHNIFSKSAFSQGLHELSSVTQRWRVLDQFHHLQRFGATRF